jgi:hypothetical protein
MGICHSDTLLGYPVQVWSVNLGSIGGEITEAQIISDHDKGIRLLFDRHV